MGPLAEGGGLEGQAHRLAPGQLGVGRLEVLQQDAPGDAVHGQVVNHQQQARGAVRPQVEQGGPQQGPGFQVEAGLQLRGAGRHGGALLVRGEGGEVDPLEGDRAFDLSHALRPAAGLTGLLGEAQAQGVVVHQEVVERRLEVPGVDGEAHLQQQGLVPVVRVGEVALEEPALDGGQRDGPADDPLLRLHHRGAPGDGRQAGHGLVLEELAGGEAQPGLVGPRHDLDAEDGVAAQGEEVVVDPDPLQAQDVGPDGGQDVLRRGAGRRHGPCAGRRAVRGGGGEGLAVDLPVGAQGQRLQDDDRRRHHVLGETVLEVVPQLVQRGLVLGALGIVGIVGVT